MTICLALKCKNIVEGIATPALLFATDTQQSSAFLKRSATKMRILAGRDPVKLKDSWKIMVASAGDAFVIDEVVSEVLFHLREVIKPDEEAPSVSLLVSRSEIGNLAYATYKRHKDRGSEGCEFELLLGTADEFTTILHVTCEGKTQDLAEYGIIGSGRITGGELLLNEFLRLYKDGISEDEAANLAALVVTTVGHVDLSVGGGPDIAICRNRLAWVYKEQPFNEMLKSSGEKWDLLKNLWRKMQKDSTFKGKLESLLNEM